MSFLLKYVSWLLLHIIFYNQATVTAAKNDDKILSVKICFEKRTSHDAQEVDNDNDNKDED